MNKWLVRAEVDLEVEAATAADAEELTRNAVRPQSSRGVDAAGVQIVFVEPR